MSADIFSEQRDQGRLEDSGEFPGVVLIDTVSYCNLRCTMCFHRRMTRKKGIMGWDLFKKIIGEISAENKDTRVWMVFFGEALLLKKRKPSIFDMIRYAKFLGLTDVVLNSNANLMDPDSAVNLVESGLDELYIGMDACTPGTYGKIRVGGDYERTVANILELIRIKEEKHSARPKIVLQYVEMEENRHEKKDFIDFWTKHGVTVKIRPKVSWAGKVEASNLVLDNAERWPCHWIMQTMSITDTGKVVACAVDLDARFIAGDVSVQSLKEVWQGKLAEIRRLHKEGRFKELPEICRSCRDWQAARADYYSTGG